jgi:hypothetical protein
MKENQGGGHEGPQEIGVILHQVDGGLVGQGGGGLVARPADSGTQEYE